MEDNEGEVEPYFCNDHEVEAMAAERRLSYWE